MDEPRNRISSEHKNSYRSSYRSMVDQKNVKRDYRETFIVQCIVCGVILCVVLFSTIIHIPAAEKLNLQLTMLIKEDSLKDMSENGIANFFGDIQNSVKPVFGESSEEQITSTTNSINQENNSSKNSQDFRIDEDILEEINKKEDFYGEPEKKIEVPKEQRQPKTTLPPELQMEQQGSRPPV